MTSLSTNQPVKAFQYEALEGFEEGVTVNHNVQFKSAAPEAILHKEEPVKAPEPAAPKFSLEELETAKALARVEGANQGYEEAKAKLEADQKERENKTFQLIQKLNAQLEILANKATESKKSFSDDIAQISYSMAQSICSKLTEKQVKDEVLSMINEVVSKTDSDDKVKVYLNPKNAADLNDKFTWAVVNSDESIALGDFKIEWANGYAERNVQKIWEEIGQIVKRHDFLEEEVKEIKQDEPIRT